VKKTQHIACFIVNNVAAADKARLTWVDGGQRSCSSDKLVDATVTLLTDLPGCHANVVM